MIDRLSTFSDPDIIKLINERFIPVAENDWYQRRRADAVGTFFRSVADQGPRDGKGGGTRQGHYAFTADGKLLAYNNNRGAGRHLEMLKAALKMWEGLPETSRAAGAVKVEVLEVGDLDKKYARLMPEGTVVIATSTRLLTKDGTQLRACEAEDNSNAWGHLAAHNQMWLQASEIEELRRLDGAVAVDLPKALAYRLMRFHMVDNTRGEPSMWESDQIKRYRITVRTPGGNPLRREIQGEVLLQAGEDRGFEASILGYFDLAATVDELTAMEVVVLGDHWGSGTYTGGARPGRTPLGIAFSLADMENDPAAKVPPQGSGWLEGYWKADR